MCAVITHLQNTIHIVIHSLNLTLGFTFDILCVCNAFLFISIAAKYERNNQYSDLCSTRITLSRAGRWATPRTGERQRKKERKEKKRRDTRTMYYFDIFFLFSVFFISVHYFVLLTQSMTEINRNQPKINRKRNRRRRKKPQKSF